VAIGLQGCSSDGEALLGNPIITHGLGCGASAMQVPIPKYMTDESTQVGVADGGGSSSKHQVIPLVGTKEMYHHSVVQHRIAAYLAVHSTRDKVM